MRGTALLVCPGIPIKTERIQASPTFWIHLTFVCSLNPNPLTKSIAVLSLVLLWYPAMTLSLRELFQARETVFPPSRKRIPEPTRQLLEALPTVGIHLVPI